MNKCFTCQKESSIFINPHNNMLSEQGLCGECHKYLIEELASADLSRITSFEESWDLMERSRKLKAFL